MEENEGQVENTDWEAAKEKVEKKEEREKEREREKQASEANEVRHVWNG